METEMQDDQIKKLIDEIKLVIADTENKQKSTGSNFNIFSVLSVEHTETKICRFLREILDPKGSHGAGSVYLKSFFEKVLGETELTQSDLDKASVKIEERIDKNRRIDMTIRAGGRTFPIEVKVYAGDQEGQCIDYYNYFNDNGIVLYFLTLDGHEPGESSKGDLIKDKNLKLISFETEILSWLKDIILSDETEKRPAIKEILIQFRNIVLKLTNKNSKEINKKLIDKIKSSEDFKAAKTITDGFESIRISKIKECLKLEYKDYEAKADSYYSKKDSSYPSLNYLLPGGKNSNGEPLALRIEINHRLFYGIVGWDGKGKVNSVLQDKLNNKTVQDYVNEHTDSDWVVDGDKRWYCWKFLGTNDGINFKEHNESYYKLYDQNGFSEEMKASCDELKEFLIKWKEHTTKISTKMS